MYLCAVDFHIEGVLAAKSRTQDPGKRRFLRQLHPRGDGEGVQLERLVVLDTDVLTLRAVK